MQWPRGVGLPLPHLPVMETVVATLTWPRGDGLLPPLPGHEATGCSRDRHLRTSRGVIFMVHRAVAPTRYFTESENLFTIILSVLSGNEIGGETRNPSGDTHKVTARDDRADRVLWGWVQATSLPSGTLEMCFPRKLFVLDKYCQFH